MKIRSLNRYFSEATKSIFRNKMMSLTSVIIVSACLLIMVLMYCVMANISNLMSNITSNIAVLAYIDNDTPWSRINEIRELVSARPEVRYVEYVDREENLRRWSMRPGFNQELFGRIDPNAVLRQYLEITVVNIEAVSGVARWLESPELFLMGIDNVSHASDDIETLNSINRVISTVSFSIIAVLAVLSVVIITNTIRLTIDGRKNEISIMKYIGSTNSFIRGPFLMEGLMLGLVGSAAPLLLVSTFYDRIINSINNNLLSGVLDQSLFLPGRSLLPVMVPSALLIGGLLGTLSSTVTIRKYLDV
jgi:cell division transport system permease protein